MLLSTGSLFGVGSGGGGSTPFALTDTGSSSATATVFTFASKSFGAADATRHMAVTITWVDSSFAGTAEINAGQVTIGGVTATRRVRAAGDNQFNNVEIWSADVPTGTTGDVVITFTTSVTRVSVAIYRMTGLSSSTPQATGTGTTSASLSANTGDYILVGSVRTATTPHTLTNVTADFALTVSSAHYAVHGSTTAVSTGTFTSTMQTNTGNAPLMAIANWR